MLLDLCSLGGPSIRAVGRGWWKEDVFGDEKMFIGISVNSRVSIHMES